MMDENLNAFKNVFSIILPGIGPNAGTYTPKISAISGMNFGFGISSGGRPLRDCDVSKYCT